jgi:hypothetical protein
MIVIDNFIKDLALLEEIKNSEEFFANPGNVKSESEDQENHTLNRMWWDGWWRSEADTLKKRIIELIFRHNPLSQTEEIQDLIKKGAGFEYYVDKFGPKEDFDELEGYLANDRLAWDLNEEFVAPQFGCIYFPLDHPVNGGFLTLEPQHLYYETLQPIFNRLIMFPTGQINQNIGKVIGGTLHTLNINLYFEETESYKQGLNIKDK